MSERAPYSRVYWSVVDDPKFRRVYDDDHHFAAWTRLLMIADQSHPASAHLPTTVRKSSVSLLAEVQLIDLQPGGRYRIHGLDSERERRRVAATSRPPKNPTPTPDGDHSGTAPGPNGFDTQGLSQAEQEPSHNENETHTARDPADIYWQLTGKYPTEKSLGWIDQLTAQYGAETVIRHLVGTHMADRSVQTLLGRTQDLLRAEARQLDKREKAEEEARLRAKRAVPRKLEPWQEEFRVELQRQYDEIETRGAA